MPDWALHYRVPGTTCIRVTYADVDVGPFLEGFYAAAEAAYSLLFWPLLDEALWEEAQFTTGPPVYQD